MILTIAGRELRSLFLSPLAWSLMAVLQLVLAWLFLLQLEAFMQMQPRLIGLENPPGLTDLVVIPLLDSAAVILMLLLPLLSMGAFSREYQGGTIGLLFSSPLSMTRLVLGKYLALLLVAGLMVLLVSLMPLSLLLGGRPDLGTLAAGLLGLALVAASYAALGLFLSSLTRQPAVAAIASYGVLLLLWILDLTGGGGGLFRQIALSSHYHRLLRGLVDSADLAYFLLLTGGALLLTIHRLVRLQSEG
ncbi:MAG TPA: ABC transporter permease [Sedimenticola sp.]|nr:ABC transporter permease [Sedimenticola sp.]